MKRLSTIVPIGTLLVATATSTACTPERRAPAPEPAKVAPEPISKADAATPAASAVPSSAPSRAVPDGGAAKVDPNLLDVVPARVAVSSAVQNPHDFPEHLLDGRSETAWNSRTGDLVGGWISFRVPDDARVVRIEMTAGFDRVKGDVDLFTANHRITKVSVTRSGTTIGEFSLDPSKRGLQSIPVNGPGGEYVITVTEVLPGTRRDWKELAVSELRVVGAPGKERRSPTDKLRVRIGSLDQEVSSLLTMELLPVTKVSRTLDDVCKSYVAAITRDRAALEQTAKEHDLKLGEPTCVVVPLGAAFAGDATYRSVAAVRLFDGISSNTNLVVETPRGFVLSPISWSTDSPLDPGCPSIVRDHTVKSLRLEHGHVVAVLTGEHGGFDLQGKWRPSDVDGAYWCKEEQGKLACQRFMAQYNGDIGRFAISEGGELRLLGQGRP
ncbi:MAG: hypothetical protein JST00_08330 [Deltaproteobacteria bacterium]|nr:hypothetical protein [Deltaproteobacteria bacterium]